MLVTYETPLEFMQVFEILRVTITCFALECRNLPDTFTYPPKVCPGKFSLHTGQIICHVFFFNIAKSI